MLDLRSEARGVGAEAVADGTAGERTGGSVSHCGARGRGREACVRTATFCRRSTLTADCWARPVRANDCDGSRKTHELSYSLTDCIGERLLHIQSSHTSASQCVSSLTHSDSGSVTCELKLTFLPSAPSDRQISRLPDTIS